MLITDAKYTKAKRIALYLDEEFAVSLEEIVWVGSGLKIKDTITGERLNELSEESNFIRAKQRAFNMLSQRGYTKARMKQKLAEKASPMAAEKATERMEELGLINDHDYGLEYASYLFSVKHFGKRRIKQCLMERGIASSLADELMEEFSFEGDDDFLRAMAVAKKKYPNCSDEKQVKRLYAGLSRYGYSYEIIKRVLEELKCEG
ncbi:MAG: regulatory protein RecX [Oscillospiraceae bacterium]